MVIQEDFRNYEELVDFSHKNFGQLTSFFNPVTQYELNAQNDPLGFANYVHPNEVNYIKNFYTDLSDVIDNKSFSQLEKTICKYFGLCLESTSIIKGSEPDFDIVSKINPQDVQNDTMGIMHFGFLEPKLKGTAVNMFNHNKPVTVFIKCTNLFWESMIFLAFQLNTSGNIKVFESENEQGYYLLKIDSITFFAEHIPSRNGWGDYVLHFKKE